MWKYFVIVQYGICSMIRFESAAVNH